MTISQDFVTSPRHLDHDFREVQVIKFIQGLAQQRIECVEFVKTEAIVGGEDAIKEFILGRSNIV